MGKGSFRNQKLGKNVSRKTSLLKSELATYKKSKSPCLSPNFPAPKDDVSLKKT
jgi:hypothetical protein